MKATLILIATLLAFSYCGLSHAVREEINTNLKEYLGNELIKIAEVNERIVRFMKQQFLLGSVKERMQNQTNDIKREIIIEQIDENPQLLKVVNHEIAFCNEATFTRALSKLSRSEIDIIANYAEQYYNFFNSDHDSMYNDIKGDISKDSAINYILSYAQDYPEICIFGTPEMSVSKLW